MFRPFDFEWNVVTLPVPSLPPALDGFRIVHLTDLHLRRRWHGAYDRLMDRLVAADADLLLFTGDFVDDKRDHTSALPNVYKMVPALRGRHGAYAVLGNHDTNRFAPRYDPTHVRLLNGVRARVPVGDATVELIGMPGAFRKDLPPDWAASIGPPADDRDGAGPRRSIRVVLSHYPDHFARVGSVLKPDLFLAGHTHGGQVCLPGGFPIIKHDSLPRRHSNGVSRIGDCWMVVGRGFGSTTLPFRLFCPPEVIEIRLLSVPAAG